MKTLEDRLAEMQADAALVKRLHSRWNHCFAGSVVLNIASVVAIFLGADVSAAFVMQFCAVGLILYARRFVHRAKQIAGKYER